jgi:glutaredoxin 3
MRADYSIIHLYSCIVVESMSRPEIRLYVSRWCAQCERAVALLEEHGLSFQTIDVGDLDGCCRLHELTGGRSVPQAVVDGRPIGGYDELAVFVRGVVSRPLDPDDRRLQPRPLRARKTA